MTLIGCKPEGRHTEQHDVYFGIANELKDLVPQLIAFWPEAKAKMHIDGWQTITSVEGYSVEVVEKGNEEATDKKLFFINLGGYKKNVFDEFHYKVLTVAVNKGEAIQQAKQTAFYRHTGFEGAPSHIDDKYGIDVDDLYEITDILTSELKEKYSIIVKPSATEKSADELHLGYFPLDKI